MADGTGTTTYGYDGLGRLTQAVQPNGTTSYGYDRDGNRTSLTYPGPSAVSYAFSNAGRLSSLTDWASRTTSYTYTPAGLPATVTLPSALGGLVSSYGYDRAQRLTNLANVAGANTVTSHAYSLDNEGNRTSMSEYVAGITAVGQSDPFVMTYDGVLRLKGVTVTKPEIFTLDAVSNLTSRTGPVAAFSYDTANRLASDGTSGYTPGATPTA